MRWYKFSIVFAIGLIAEVVIAALSCALIKQNGEWLAKLILPGFAPKNFAVYGILMEINYLSSALSCAFYVKEKRELPKGVMLLFVEGLSDVVTLAFFFRFTYEITSFFFATATMILGVVVTSFHLKKSWIAGVARLPVLSIHSFLWSVLYCILMLNFT